MLFCITHCSSSSTSYVHLHVMRLVPAAVRLDACPFAPHRCLTAEQATAEGEGGICCSSSSSSSIVKAESQGGHAASSQAQERSPAFLRPLLLLLQLSSLGEAECYEMGRPATSSGSKGQDNT
jgi:hypothetical protein